MELVNNAVRILVFVAGAVVVVRTLISAIQTFILPRSAPDRFTRLVFLGVRRVFDVWMIGASSYAERDRIMAFFAPISLLVLPGAWLTVVLIGYMGMFWALGVPSWWDAFALSGSSLLTLGFVLPKETVPTILVFSEAVVGLGLLALLIAYLPTMYAAFSRRETAVTLLEVRAGAPPSAVGMIERFHRLQWLDRLGEQWAQWEAWFADIEESHTSLGAMAFFRSPRPGHSWVTAAGAILDAAALAASTLDIPRDPHAALCLRAGYLALRHIADYFAIPYPPDPRPDDPISVTRQEFEAAYEHLAGQGVPLKPDREQAWRDFAGWRVNYDTVLLALAGVTMAPEAPWSGDRAVAHSRRDTDVRPPLFNRPRKGKISGIEEVQHEQSRH